MQKKITTIKDMMLWVGAGISISAGYLLYVLVSAFADKRNQNRTIDQLIKRNQKRFDEKVNRNNADIDAAPIEDLLEDGEYLKK